MRTGRLLGFFAFALHRLPADVAAAEAFRPFDPVDCRVGAPLRLRDRLSGGAEVQHAPAIGENVSVLRNRSSMEELDALALADFIETPNDGPLAVITGIAPCGHDHRKRCILVPSQAEIL